MYRLLLPWAFWAAIATTPAGAQRPLPSYEGRPAYVVPEQQPAKFLLYNMLLGAGIGGAGAAMNGTEGTAWDRFWRGAGRGALGGALLYEGKRLAHLIVQEEQPAYGLLAVGVHELGGSIVENASYDRAPLDRLHLHTGFLRWEWRPGGGAQVRLMPFSALAFAYLATQHQLDLRLSAYTLTPVFSGSGFQPYPVFDDVERTGFAFANAVYVTAATRYGRPTQERKLGVLAHEVVHALQYREFIRTAALHRPLTRLFERERWYGWVGRRLYVDSPHLFIAAYGLSSLQARDPRCYYNNWLEREAEALSENRPVAVCR